MLFNVSKITGFRHYLLTVALLAFCLSTSLHAQVPDIDHTATVNPATGEMVTSIPLGVVKGVGNGHDFPVNLYYKAGILTSQEASPAGLGFSYGAGSITRRTVFIPDDCPGSSALQYSSDREPFCFEYGWRFYWKLITLVITSAVAVAATLVTNGLALPAYISMLMSAGASLQLSAIQQIIFDTPDFSAGGSHVPTYNYTHNDKKGFFKGGAAADLPDIYFINSPYLNGQLLWFGDPVNGKFVLKQSSSISNECTVTYDHVNESFTVVAAGGITMVFDKADKYGNWHYSDYEQNEDEVACSFLSELKQFGALPVQWHLTRILYPDYIDGTGGNDNDPLNSLSSNKGNWICFNYNETLNASISRGDNSFTIEGPFSRQANMVGKKNSSYDGVTIYQLAGVTTPNETATFDYINDRKDGLWYESGTTNPVYQPRLSGIRFFSKDGTKKREIEFLTEYKLRQGTRNSVATADNPDKASLTLKAVSVKGMDGTILPPIQFEYGYNPDAEMYPTTQPTNGHSINAERRDLWGYYSPNTPNDWNADGLQNRAIDASTGQVYAAAWSLKRMLLPSGKIIEWEYEANRYKFANNVQMRDDASNPQVKYGDGIRVKTMTVRDGQGKSKTTSFFYTQMQTPGVFEETGNNSAGHATAIPYPCILTELQDKRPTVTRGGFYTPTKVAYGMCVVADNYNWAMHVAPNGYTAFEFITSSRFQNGGPNGESDESWRRGFLNSVTQYNASNVQVHKTVNYYRCIPNISYPLVNNGTYLTSGTVQLIRQTNTRNGVTTEVKCSYADEVPSVSAGTDRDNTTFNNKVYNYAVVPLVPTGWNLQPPTGYSVKGRFIGGSGYDDMVTVIHRSGYFDAGGNYNFIDGLEIAVIYDYNDPEKVSAASLRRIELYRDHQFPMVGPDVTRFKRGNFDFQNLKLYIVPVNATTIDVYVTFFCREQYLDDDEIVRTGLVEYYAKIAGITSGSNGTKTLGDQFDPNGAMPPADLTPVGAGLKLSNIHFSTEVDEAGNDSYADAIVDCRHTLILDVDGRPNRVTTINSGEKILIKEITPAFTQSAYSDMLTDKILAPVCQTTTMGKGPDITDVEYVVSAQATKWSKTAGTPAWMPCSMYVWKTNFQADGTPDRTFANFDHTSGATNPNWQYTGSVTKYNPNSQPLETGKPTSTGNQSQSAMVYGHGNVVPIGSIVNASFFECGVFTGDYDKNEAVTGYFSYFDKENGWEKHFGTVVDVPANRLHFGQKVLKIENGEGAMRNFKIRANTPYEASVWAYVESGSGNGFYLNAEIRSGIAPTDPWPVTWQNLPAVLTTKTSDKLTSTNGKWQLVKVMIPAQADPGSGNELWIRLTVGKNGETFLAYVDDIRFAPAKALVTSTYYDQLWHQPILSVDANNNPSQKVVYDDFGRPIEWYKIDKSNPVNATLLQSKKYHLMSDWSTPEPNKWYKIVSELNENYCIDILNQTWVDGQLIQLWTYAGTSNQQWKFVSTGDGYYQIVSRGGTTFGIDDPYGNITNGTQLKIWTLGGDNQKWKFTDAGGGCCRIAAKAGASAYIDLENGTVANGTKLQIWQNGANSKWKMVEVP